MIYQAEIHIMPKKELLDPQGRTVDNNLKMASIEGINKVRIGKHVQLEVDATNEEEAYKIVEDASRKLFVNLNTESYTIVIKDKV